MSAALIAALLFLLAALVTAAPRAAIQRRCLIGYKAVCPFTPVSTLLLLVVAGILFVVGSAA